MCMRARVCVRVYGSECECARACVRPCPPPLHMPRLCCRDRALMVVQVSACASGIALVRELGLGPVCVAVIVRASACMTRARLRLLVIAHWRAR